MELRPHVLTAALLTSGIRRLIGFTRFLPVGPCQCSTPVCTFSRRQPKSCFGENQLFPDSISFSLLTTSHPKTLYDLRVRASIPLSRNFALLMASSSGFGSYLCYERAINARFPYSSAPEGLSYAAWTHSPAHSSIGTRSRYDLRHPFPPFVSTRFQFYFTPLSGFFSPFPRGTSSLSVIGCI